MPTSTCTSSRRICRASGPISASIPVNEDPDATSTDRAHRPDLRAAQPSQGYAGAIGRLPRSELNPLPLAVCFPLDDGGFAARVRTLLDGSHAEWPFAAAVQALLRETYPLAVISPRHQPAGTRAWFAFRDGSAVPSVAGDTS